MQAIALYYGQQRQVEEQTRQGVRQAEIASDVRSIVADIQKSNLKEVELQYEMSGIDQRVRVLESGAQGAKRP